ncbi:MAG: pseudouridine synthase [Sphingobacteriaceae bacterium]|nr:pseudouridine synthase [Sphingobacteriaceae bacterium]
MKVDKYLALYSDYSRRKAFELIEAKKVLVNGKTANFSTKVNLGDIVLADSVEIKEKKIQELIIAYNKPKGVICTTEKIEGNIIDALNFKEKIFPIGRLDKESEGLILLTNKGEFVDKIANPKFQHEKEYIVTLNFPVRTAFLKEIRNGINLDGEITLPCKAEVIEGTKRLFKIILNQGLNRQIRRMCNAYDYQVLKLQRVRVMNIKLDKLKLGEWRELTSEEKIELYKNIE